MQKQSSSRQTHIPKKINKKPTTQWLLLPLFSSSDRHPSGLNTLADILYSMCTKKSHQCKKWSSSVTNCLPSLPQHSVCQQITFLRGSTWQWTPPQVSGNCCLPTKFNNAEAKSLSVQVKKIFTWVANSKQVI